MALAQTRSFDFSVFAESAWYRPLAPLLALLGAPADFPSTDALTALYRQRVAGSECAPLVFVPAPPKSKKRRRAHTPIALSSLYEGRIVEAHEVPTRVADWHDLFNALSFCAFPRAKWALHARQYRCYAARLTPGMTRLPGARTREQDALALFDEGGLLVCLPQAAAAELPRDDVDQLDRVLTTRVRQGDARAVPFGHALYEHLALGHPPPLAYAQVLAFAGPVPDPAACTDFSALDAIDRVLAGMIDDTREFSEPSRARGLSLAALSACDA